MRQDLVATIHPADLNESDVEKAIARIVEHDGRILSGPSVADRAEIDKLAAISLILSRTTLKPPYPRIYFTRYPKPRPIAKADQWLKACNQVEEGLEIMLDLQSDADGWLSRIAHRGQASMKQILRSILDLPLAQMHHTTQDAGTIEYPRGFGRDKR